MSVDKNQAMIQFLLQCPTILANPLFFNFAKAKENNNQFMTLSNNTNLHEPYIDGSVLKQYNFILLTYKTISFNQIIKQEGYPDENITEVAQFQEVLDWVKDQALAFPPNYPDFGEDCVIDKMEVLSDNPVLYDVDESVSPPLARYSITIRIEYLDNSQKMWQN
jgi:hypothetical protein